MSLFNLFAFPAPLFYDPFLRIEALLRNDPIFILNHPEQTQQQPQQQTQQQTQQQPQQQPQQQTQQQTQQPQEYQYYYYHSTEKHPNGYIEVHEVTNENGKERKVHTQGFNDRLKTIETNRDQNGVERTTEKLVNISNRESFEKELQSFQKKMKALH
jgi:hypothetical protein